MVRSQEVRPLTISRLAEAGGVGVETVRFYQRRGLLDVPPRAGGIRRYGAEDVRRLRFIRQAQEAGFRLSEIAELLALDSGTDRARARALAEGRIAALDREIARLERARASLERLARACGADAEGPCPILASFDAPFSHGGGMGSKPLSPRERIRSLGDEGA
ncbi:MAG: MerR family transcriptional regulator [Allosphingosinicella sp.]|uniref:MerR family transcriptional regulator n=1 Tax=Allosphingosinicella sp. TaxID=2823234 RepID=UPI00393F83BB